MVQLAIQVGIALEQASLLNELEQAQKVLRLRDRAIASASNAIFITDPLWHLKKEAREREIELGLVFWGLIFLFSACGIIGVFSSHSSDSSCYGQGGQDILRRGNKAVEGSDVERYYSELKSRCG